ncbi:MAG: methyltransferase domain-containing protein, partial [Burkholderiales bacterium]
SRPRPEIQARVQTSLGEAAIGLRLLDGIDLTGKRVLEVGAGIGIVSLVLHRSGVEVVAIEPGLGGFDQNAVIGVCLRERLKTPNFPYLSIGAADLRPEIHGLFDVQFSVNVLEHIPDLEAAVAAMCGVLKPGGVVRHTCPNYLIPYEPHFGIPLVPLVPRATAWLLPRIGDTDLWRSLNFVTLGRMKRAFAQYGLNCQFSPGTMYAAFERLDHDVQFQKRQGGMTVVSFAHRTLRGLGLIRLLKHLPPVLATPMTFEARYLATPEAKVTRSI